MFKARRWLSFLLAILMVVSVVPTGAFAQEGTPPPVEENIGEGVVDPSLTSPDPTEQPGDDPPEPPDDKQDDNSSEGEQPEGEIDASSAGANLPPDDEQPPEEELSPATMTSATDVGFNSNGRLTGTIVINDMAGQTSRALRLLLAPRFAVKLQGSMDIAKSLLIDLANLYGGHLSYESVVGSGLPYMVFDIVIPPADQSNDVVASAANNVATIDLSKLPTTVGGGVTALDGNVTGIFLDDVKQEIINRGITLGDGSEEDAYFQYEVMLRTTDGGGLRVGDAQNNTTMIQKFVPPSKPKEAELVAYFDEECKQPITDIISIAKMASHSNSSWYKHEDAYLPVEYGLHEFVFYIKNEGGVPATNIAMSGNGDFSSSLHPPTYEIGGNAAAYSSLPSGESVAVTLVVSAAFVSTEQQLGSVSFSYSGNSSDLSTSVPFIFMVDGAVVYYHEKTVEFSVYQGTATMIPGSGSNTVTISASADANIAGFLGEEEKSELDDLIIKDSKDVALIKIDQDCGVDDEDNSPWYIYGYITEDNLNGYNTTSFTIGQDDAKTFTFEPAEAINNDTGVYTFKVYLCNADEELYMVSNFTVIIHVVEPESGITVTPSSHNWSLTKGTNYSAVAEQRKAITLTNRGTGTESVTLTIPESLQGKLVLCNNIGTQLSDGNTHTLDVPASGAVTVYVRPTDTAAAAEFERTTQNLVVSWGDGTANVALTLTVSEAVYSAGVTLNKDGDAWNGDMGDTGDIFVYAFPSVSNPELGIDNDNLIVSNYADNKHTFYGLTAAAYDIYMGTSKKTAVKVSDESGYGSIGTLANEGDVTIHMVTVTASDGEEEGDLATLTRNAVQGVVASQTTGVFFVGEVVDIVAAAMSGTVPFKEWERSGTSANGTFNDAAIATTTYTVGSADANVTLTATYAVPTPTTYEATITTTLNGEPSNTYKPFLFVAGETPETGNANLIEVSATPTGTWIFTLPVNTSYDIYVGATAATAVKLTVNEGYGEIFEGFAGPITIAMVTVSVDTATNPSAEFDTSPVSLAAGVLKIPEVSGTTGVFIVNEEVTLTADNSATGTGEVTYNFESFTYGDSETLASSDGTGATKTATYTVGAGAAVTITANYTASYAVTVRAGAGGLVNDGTDNKTTYNTNVDHDGTLALKAVPIDTTAIDAFRFDNWAMGDIGAAPKVDSTEVHSAEGNTGAITASGTITANFANIAVDTAGGFGDDADWSNDKVAVALTTGYSETTVTIPLKNAGSATTKAFTGTITGDGVSDKFTAGSIATAVAADGTSSVTLTIATGLADGTYSGTLTLTEADDAGLTLEIPFTVTVENPSTFATTIQLNVDGTNMVASNTYENPVVRLKASGGAYVDAANISLTNGTYSVSGLAWGETYTVYVNGYATSVTVTNANMGGTVPVNNLHTVGFSGASYEGITSYSLTTKPDDGSDALTINDDATFHVVPDGGKVDLSATPTTSGSHYRFKQWQSSTGGGELADIEDATAEELDDHTITGTPAAGGIRFAPTAQLQYLFTVSISGGTPASVKINDETVDSLYVDANSTVSVEVVLASGDQTLGTWSGEGTGTLDQANLLQPTVAGIATNYTLSATISATPFTGTVYITDSSSTALTGVGTVKLMSGSNEYTMTESPNGTWTTEDGALSFGTSYDIYLNNVKVTGTMGSVTVPQIYKTTQSATLVLDAVTMNTETGGSGSVTAANYDGSTADNVYYFFEGTTVEITATANSGYRLGNSDETAIWTVAGATLTDANAAETTFAMPANAVTLTPLFTQTVVITAAKAPNEAAYTATINNGASATVDASSTGHTLAASTTHARGGKFQAARFDKWVVTPATNGGSVSDDTYTAGTEAATVTANFAALNASASNKTGVVVTANETTGGIAWTVAQGYIPGSYELELTVTNNGAVALTGLTAALQNTTDSPFNVTALSTSINVGGTATVTISIKQLVASANPYTDNLIISEGVVDGLTLTIPLSLTVNLADFNVAIRTQKNGTGEDSDVGLVELSANGTNFTAGTYNETTDSYDFAGLTPGSFVTPTTYTVYVNGVTTGETVTYANGAAGKTVTNLIDLTMANVDEGIPFFTYTKETGSTLATDEGSVTVDGTTVTVTESTIVLPLGTAVTAKANPVRSGEIYYRFAGKESEAGWTATHNGGAHTGFANNKVVDAAYTLPTDHPTVNPANTGVILTPSYVKQHMVTITKPGVGTITYTEKGGEPVVLAEDTKNVFVDEDSYVMISYDEGDAADTHELSVWTNTGSGVFSENDTLTDGEVSAPDTKTTYFFPKGNETVTVILKEFPTLSIASGAGTESETGSAVFDYGPGAAPGKKDVPPTFNFDKKSGTLKRIIIVQGDESPSDVSENTSVTVDDGTGDFGNTGIYTIDAGALGSLQPGEYTIWFIDTSDDTDSGGFDNANKYNKSVPLIVKQTPVTLTGVSIGEASDNDGTYDVSLNASTRQTAEYKAHTASSGTSTDISTDNLHFIWYAVPHDTVVSTTTGGDISVTFNEGDGDDKPIVKNGDEVLTALANDTNLDLNILITTAQKGMQVFAYVYATGAGEGWVLSNALTVDYDAAVNVYLDTTPAGSTDGDVLYLHTSGDWDGLGGGIALSWNDTTYTTTNSALVQGTEYYLYAAPVRANATLTPVMVGADAAIDAPGETGTVIYYTVSHETAVEQNNFTANSGVTWAANSKNITAFYDADANSALDGGETLTNGTSAILKGESAHFTIPEWDHDYTLGWGHGGTDYDSSTKFGADQALAPANRTQSLEYSAAHGTVRGEVLQKTYTITGTYVNVGSIREVTLTNGLDVYTATVGSGIDGGTVTMTVPMGNYTLSAERNGSYTITGYEIPKGTTADPTAKTVDVVADDQSLTDRFHILTTTSDSKLVLPEETEWSDPATPYTFTHKTQLIVGYNAEVPVTLPVKNGGNVAIKDAVIAVSDETHGFTIAPSDGAEIASFDLAVDGDEAQKNFTVTVPEDLTVGNYEVIYTVTYPDPTGTGGADIVYSYIVKVDVAPRNLSTVTIDHSNNTLSMGTHTMGRGANLDSEAKMLTPSASDSIENFKLTADQLEVTANHIEYLWYRVAPGTSLAGKVTGSNGTYQLSDLTPIGTGATYEVTAEDAGYDIYLLVRGKSYSTSATAPDAQYYALSETPFSVPYTATVQIKVDSNVLSDVTGYSVILRNKAGGNEIVSTTEIDGKFSFTGLDNDEVYDVYVSYYKGGTNYVDSTLEVSGTSASATVQYHTVNYTAAPTVDHAVTPDDGYIDAEIITQGAYPFAVAFPANVSGINVNGDTVSVATEGATVTNGIPVLKGAEVRFTPNTSHGKDYTFTWETVLDENAEVQTLIYDAAKANVTAKLTRNTYEVAIWRNGPSDGIASITASRTVGVDTESYTFSSSSSPAINDALSATQAQIGTVKLPKTLAGSEYTITVVTKNDRTVTSYYVPHNIVIPITTPALEVPSNTSFQINMANALYAVEWQRKNTDPDPDPEYITDNAETLSKVYGTSDAPAVDLRFVNKSNVALQSVVLTLDPATHAGNFTFGTAQVKTFGGADFVTAVTLVDSKYTIDTIPQGGYVDFTVTAIAGAVNAGTYNLPIVATFTNSGTATGSRTFTATLEIARAPIVDASIMGATAVAPITSPATGVAAETVATIADITPALSATLEATEGVNIQWYPTLPADGKFAPGVSYTARVTLNASPNHYFDIDTYKPAYKINGTADATSEAAVTVTAINTGYNGSGLTLAIKFPATMLNAVELEVVGIGPKSDGDPNAGRINYISSQANESIDFYYVVTNSETVPTSADLYAYVTGETQAGTLGGATVYDFGSQLDVPSVSGVAKTGNIILAGAKANYAAGETYYVHAIGKPTSDIVGSTLSDVATEPFTTHYEIRVNYANAAETAKGKIVIPYAATYPTSIYIPADGSSMRPLVAEGFMNYVPDVWVLDDGTADLFGADETTAYTSGGVAYIKPSGNATVVVSFKGQPALTNQGMNKGDQVPLGYAPFDVFVIGSNPGKIKNSGSGPISSAGLEAIVVVDDFGTEPSAVPGDITPENDSDTFAVSFVGSTVLDPAATVDISVKPKAGLPAGQHSAKIYVYDATDKTIFTSFDVYILVVSGDKPALNPLPYKYDLAGVNAPWTIEVTEPGTNKGWDFKTSESYVYYGAGYIASTAVSKTVAAIEDAHDWTFTLTVDDIEQIISSNRVAGAKHNLRVTLAKDSAEVAYAPTADNFYIEIVDTRPVITKVKVDGPIDDTLSVTEVEHEKPGGETGSITGDDLGTELEYQWKVSDDGEYWTEITYANDKDYTLTDDDQGKYIKVTVTDKDSGADDVDYVGPKDSEPVRIGYTAGVTVRVDDAAPTYGSGYKIELRADGKPTVVLNCVIGTNNYTSEAYALDPAVTYTIYASPIKSESVNAVTTDTQYNTSSDNFVDYYTVRYTDAVNYANSGAPNDTRMSDGTRGATLSAKINGTETTLANNAPVLENTVVDFTVKSYTDYSNGWSDADVPVEYKLQFGGSATDTATLYAATVPSPTVTQSRTYTERDETGVSAALNLTFYDVRFSVAGTGIPAGNGVTGITLKQSGTSTPIVPVGGAISGAVGQAGTISFKLPKGDYEINSITLSSGVSLDKYIWQNDNQTTLDATVDSTRNYTSGNQIVLRASRYNISFADNKDATHSTGSFNTPNAETVFSIPAGVLTYNNTAANRTYAVRVYNDGESIPNFTLGWAGGSAPAGLSIANLASVQLKQKSNDQAIGTADFETGAEFPADTYFELTLTLTVSGNAGGYNTTDSIALVGGSREVTVSTNSFTPSFTISKAKITAAHVTEIAAPSVGAPVVAEAVVTSFPVSTIDSPAIVTWSTGGAPVTESFEGGKTYTATVELTPDDAVNYEFDLTATYNSAFTILGLANGDVLEGALESATVTRTADKVTMTYTFKPTAPVLSSVTLAGTDYYSAKATVSGAPTSGVTYYFALVKETDVTASGSPDAEEIKTRTGYVPTAIYASGTSPVADFGALAESLQLASNTWYRVFVTTEVTSASGTSALSNVVDDDDLTWLKLTIKKAPSTDNLNRIGYNYAAQGRVLAPNTGSSFTIGVKQGESIELNHTAYAGYTLQGWQEFGTYVGTETVANGTTVTPSAYTPTLDDRIVVAFFEMSPLEAIGATLNTTYGADYTYTLPTTNGSLVTNVVGQITYTFKEYSGIKVGSSVTGGTQSDFTALTGLSFNGTKISGKPQVVTTDNSYVVTLTATDAATGQTVDVNITINIAQATPNVTFLYPDPTAPANWIIGDPLDDPSYTVNANNNRLQGISTAAADWFDPNAGNWGSGSIDIKQSGDTWAFTADAYFKTGSPATYPTSYQSTKLDANGNQVFKSVVGSVGITAIKGDSTTNLQVTSNYLATTEYLSGILDGPESPYNEFTIKNNGTEAVEITTSVAATGISNLTAEELVNLAKLFQISGGTISITAGTESKVTVNITSNTDAQDALKKLNVGLYDTQIKVNIMVGGSLVATVPLKIQVTPKAIDAATITGVVRPVAGATPVTTGLTVDIPDDYGTGKDANGNDIFTFGNVSWSDNPSKFIAQTVYTASVTLTAGSNYYFEDVGTDNYDLYDSSGTLYGTTATRNPDTDTAANTINLSTNLPTSGMGVVELNADSKGPSATPDKVDGEILYMQTESGNDVDFYYLVTDKKIDDFTALDVDYFDDDGTDGYVTNGMKTADSNNGVAKVVLVDIPGLEPGKEYYVYVIATPKDDYRTQTAVVEDTFTTHYKVTVELGAGGEGANFAVDASNTAVMYIKPGESTGVISASAQVKYRFDKWEIVGEQNVGGFTNSNATTSTGGTATYDANATKFWPTGNATIRITFAPAAELVIKGTPNGDTLSEGYGGTPEVFVDGYVKNRGPGATDGLGLYVYYETGSEFDNAETLKDLLNTLPDSVPAVHDWFNVFIGAGAANEDSTVDLAYNQEIDLSVTAKNGLEEGVYKAIVYVYDPADPTVFDSVLIVFKVGSPDQPNLKPMQWVYDLNPDPAIDNARDIVIDKAGVTIKADSFVFHGETGDKTLVANVDYTLDTSVAGQTTIKFTDAQLKKLIDDTGCVTIDQKADKVPYKFDLTLVHEGDEYPIEFDDSGTGSYGDNLRMFVIDTSPRLVAASITSTSPLKVDDNATLSTVSYVTSQYTFNIEQVGATSETRDVVTVTTTNPVPVPAEKLGGLSYQWKSADTATAAGTNNTTIAQNHTVTGGDMGKYLYLEVTGGGGYTGRVDSNRLYANTTLTLTTSEYIVNVETVKSGIGTAYITQAGGSAVQDTTTTYLVDGGKATITAIAGEDHVFRRWRVTEGTAENISIANVHDAETTVTFLNGPVEVTAVFDLKPTLAITNDSYDVGYFLTDSVTEPTLTYKQNGGGTVTSVKVVPMSGGAGFLTGELSYTVPMLSVGGTPLDTLTFTGNGATPVDYTLNGAWLQQNLKPGTYEIIFVDSKGDEYLTDVPLTITKNKVEIDDVVVNSVAANLTIKDRQDLTTSVPGSILVIDTLLPAELATHIEQPGQVSYQWYSAADDTLAGVAISGETYATYTATSDDTNKWVYLVITALGTSDFTEYTTLVSNRIEIETPSGFVTNITVTAKQYSLDEDKDGSFAMTAVGTVAASSVTGTIAAADSIDGSSAVTSGDNPLTNVAVGTEITLDATVLSRYGYMKFERWRIADDSEGTGQFSNGATSERTIFIPQTGDKVIKVEAVFKPRTMTFVGKTLEFEYHSTVTQTLNAVGDGSSFDNYEFRWTLKNNNGQADAWLPANGVVNTGTAATITLTPDVSGVNPIPSITLFNYVYDITVYDKVTGQTVTAEHNLKVAPAPVAIDTAPTYETNPDYATAWAAGTPVDLGRYLSAGKVIGTNDVECVDQIIGSWKLAADAPVVIQDSSTRQYHIEFIPADPNHLTIDTNIGIVGDTLDGAMTIENNVFGSATPDPNSNYPDLTTTVFDTVQFGYGDSYTPKPSMVVVKNIGDSALTNVSIAVTADFSVVGSTTGWSIPVGGSIEVRVRPVAGLDVGTYSGSITVTGTWSDGVKDNNVTSNSYSLSFEVEPYIIRGASLNGVKVVIANGDTLPTTVGKQPFPLVEDDDSGYYQVKSVEWFVGQTPVSDMTAKASTRYTQRITIEVKDAYDGSAIFGEVSQANPFNYLINGEGVVLGDTNESGWIITSYGNNRVVFEKVYTPTKIDEIIVGNIEKPLEGNKPSVPKVDNDEPYTITDWKWVEVDDDGFEVKVLTQDDTFEKDKEYKLEVTVKPKEGYEFEDGLTDDDAWFTVGGIDENPQTLTGDSDGYEMDNTWTAEAKPVEPPPGPDPGPGPGGGDDKFIVNYRVGEHGTTKDLASEEVRAGRRPRNVPNVTALDGYEFLGWSTQDPETVTGEIKLVDPTTVYINDDTVFYAVYRSTEVVDNDLYKPFYHEHYMIGYPDGGFRPDRHITRAEVATIIARAILPGFVEFSDYSEGNLYSDIDGHWAQSAIEYVTKHGVFVGYSDGTFRPQRPITREEYALVIARLESLTAAQDMEFTDAGTISDWANDGVYTCYMNGWIVGYEHKDTPDTFYFDPQRNITRTEAAKIMNGYLRRGVDEEGLAELDTYIVWPDVPETFWGYYEVVEATNDHYFYYDILGNDGDAIPPEQWFEEAGYFVDDPEFRESVNDVIQRKNPLYKEPE